MGIFIPTKLTQLLRARVGTQGCLIPKFFLLPLMWNVLGPSTTQRWIQGMTRKNIQAGQCGTYIFNKQIYRNRSAEQRELFSISYGVARDLLTNEPGSPC